MEEIKAALVRYVNHKIPTGGFLLAVLKNDLKEACGRADMTNRYRLFEIVSYCYNEIPNDCWGSPEKVEIWLNKKQKESNDVSK